MQNSIFWRVYRLIPPLAHAAAQTQRPIQMSVQPNIQMQMLPTASISTDTSHLTTVPQLTGSLTLSFSEDGRLLLKHNANQPQDSQSQMILQAFLSGALANGKYYHFAPFPRDWYHFD